MPTGAHLLRGVDPILGGLLDELTSRAGKGNRELPVVVLLGVRGAGKSAVLGALHERCEYMPRSVQDFERWDEIEPREMLGRIAFDLSEHVPQFGRMAFPRLLLCMLALGLPVGADRREALRRLQKLLARNQSLERNRERVVEFVDGIASAGPWSVAGLAEATDVLLRGLSRVDRWRLTRCIRAIPSQAGKPEDFLVGIAHRAHGDEEDRATLDASLCDAFLADLRRGYLGFNSSVRTANPVLLLDNAHTPSGRAFLRELTEARHRAGDEHDPLVVFATSRAWNPDWSDDWSQVTVGPAERPASVLRPHELPPPEPRQPADVGADQPASAGAEGRWYPWYLVELGALSTQDVGDVVREHEIYGVSPVARFLHRLTDGHPGAVHSVLPAVLDKWDPDNPSALRESLFAPEGNPGTRMLLTKVSADLLQDFSEPERRQLVTASASADVEMLFNNDILGAHDPAIEGALFERLKDELWLRTDPADPSRFVLHPWLRRVLLRELAMRADDDESSWARTHQRCREFYLAEERLTEARYHDLALENFEPVVAHLRESLEIPHAEFGDDAARAWLAELYRITAAPNRLVEDVDPYGQVDQRVGDRKPGLGKNLAWLVVSLWISRDPLGDPGRKLTPVIRNCLHELAHGRGHGAMKLHQHAEEYR